VDESEFPSNKRPAVRPTSAKKETVEKVVTGKVVTRRKPLTRRFAETFIAEDSQSVGRYILLEVLIPAAKDLISDMVSQAVDRTLFGGRRNARSGYRPSGSSGHVSYNRYASPTQGSPWRRDEERQGISRTARRNHNFDEIVLATRVEANEVIDRLFDLISKYEQATVSDLYDLVGLEAKFTDEKWGWRDMRGVQAIRVGGGYLLDLPKPEQLD